MIVKVTVTWGKEVFKNVEVDTAQSPLTFKTQLFSLTGVPPDRQKIMGVKGGLLKDDADWTKLGLKTGQKLMLMGSAEQVWTRLLAADERTLFAVCTVQKAYAKAVWYCSGAMLRNTALAAIKGSSSVFV